jgi:hypothetical protein
MMTHCQRGEEAIVGQQWHTNRWEAGGMAVLGSIQPQPLEYQPDGTIALSPKGLQAGHRKSMSSNRVYFLFLQLVISILTRSPVCAIAISSCEAAIHDS